MSLGYSNDFKGAMEESEGNADAKASKKQSSLGNESSLQRRQADVEKTADELEMHKEIQKMRQRIYVLAEKNRERESQNLYPLPANLHM